MDHDPLLVWLGLAPGPWPPDHYALLALPPGRCDPATLEVRVLERMERLRRHQLRHPELSTEGMNRLAQALVVLTDPVAKAAYDTGLGITAPVADNPSSTPSPRPAATTSQWDESLVVGELVFDDVFSDDVLSPATVEQGEATQVIAPARSLNELPGITAEGRLPARYDMLPDAVVGRDDSEREGPEIDDPQGAVGVVEAVAIDASEGVPKVDGPVGQRWIYAHLARVRRGQRAWDRLGGFLGDPRDPVDGPGRVLRFLEAVDAVRPALLNLRGVVGGVGEPGGIVAAIVNQPLALDAFRRLLSGQRQAVAIDWRRGLEALQREYDRLRELTRSYRQRRAGTRRGFALVRWAIETPEVMLVLLAGLALVLSLLRSVSGR